MNGKTFKKIASAHARKGVKGEKIVTMLKGDTKSETSNTVKDNTSWVIHGVGGEEYIITGEQFEANYNNFGKKPTDESLAKKGFLEYMSKRKIVTHRVKAADMDWFRVDCDDTHVHFLAPWGEFMLVEEGDVLAMTYPPEDTPEIYRIKWSIFNESYTLTKL